MEIFTRNIVGNKAKGRISKRVPQESKARQNFRKTNISYPLIRTRTKIVNVTFLQIFLETFLEIFNATFLPITL